ncbi:MAG: hypothetical protein J4G13_16400 [Dehalococcoidia bacterium]|nr:hypothetical protein [Dehalococcoidia bacterium]
MPSAAASTTTPRFCFLRAAPRPGIRCVPCRRRLDMCRRSSMAGKTICIWNPSSAIGSEGFRSRSRSYRPRSVKRRFYWRPPTPTVIGG